MTSRRSFFTRLAQFAAVVAIAPQIAFGRKVEVAAPVQYWVQHTRWTTHTSAAYEALVDKLFKDNPNYAKDYLQ